MRDDTAHLLSSEENAKRLRAAIASFDGLSFHLAQLRHAYSHLMAERVTDQRQFADGLIAPAIEYLETLADQQAGTPCAKCK